MLHFSLQGQNSSCKFFLSPLEFNADSVLGKNSVAHVEKAIHAAAVKKLRINFTEDTIQAYVKTWEACNQEISEKLLQIQKQRDLISQAQQKLTDNDKIGSLQKKLVELQDAKVQLAKQTGENLQAIRFQAIYVIVIKNVDDLTSTREVMEEQVSAALRNTAIKDLRGVFVQSKTTVGNHQLLDDWIRLESSGELRREGQNILEDFNSIQHYYINCSQLVVAPLKSDSSLRKATTASTIGQVLTPINVLATANWKEVLRTHQVSEEDIQAIERAIATKQSGIDKNTQLNADKEKEIIREFVANNAKLNDQMLAAENELKNIYQFLQTLVGNQIQVNANNAIQILKSQREAYNNQAKEKTTEYEVLEAKKWVWQPLEELIYDNNANNAIANKTVDLVAIIAANLTKEESQSSSIEVFNGQLIRDEKKEGRRKVKKLVKVWLYLSPGASNKRKITILSSFEWDLQQESTTPKPVVPKPVANEGDKLNNEKKEEPSIKPNERINKLIEAKQSFLIDTLWPKSIQELVKSMVRIPGGEFLIGCESGNAQDCDADGKEYVKIKLAPFFMSKYEITQQQWYDLVKNTPKENKELNPVPSSNREKKLWNNPVTDVSWEDCQEFIARLNKLTKLNFQLPSEAQWEYACRAGTTTPFNTGACLSTTDANYDGNYPYEGCSKGTYLQGTNKVGSYKANAWGLYDMHGNVWEWCQDWYHDSYTGIPTDGKARESPTGSIRVLRGGSWNDGAQGCRSADRGSITPDARHFSFGFRLLSSGTP